MSNLIMVVDDEDSVRALLREVLTTAGYDVIEATGGASVQEALHGPQPEVILMDF